MSIVETRRADKTTLNTGDSVAKCQRTATVWQWTNHAGDAMAEGSF